MWSLTLVRSLDHCALASSLASVPRVRAYQQIENHTLQQLIYHRTVKLSPLAIAISVAAGAEIGGVVGALLGIPFAGALKVVSACCRR
jgi:AI-2E family transporter